MESENFEEILETNRKMFECMEEVEKLGRDIPELRTMKASLTRLQERIDELRVQRQITNPEIN